MSTWEQQKLTGQHGQFGELDRRDNAGILLADPDVPSVETPTVMVVASQIAEAQARIDKANRRLERAGIDERFTIEWGDPEIREVQLDGGATVKREFRQLTLSSPAISYGGYEFVAALDQVGDGFVARTRPGADLQGWRPDAQMCDHCHTRRHRNSTYVLRETATGEVIQVGSACMDNFLGVKPEGLWSLGYDPLESDDGELWIRSSGGVRDSMQDTRLVVAAALVVSRMGSDYRPSSFDSSTSAAVKDILYGYGGSSEVQAARAQLRVEAERLAAEAGTVDEVLAAVNEMSGDSDYVSNMRLLAGAEHTGYRHTGLMASAVAVWNKNRERKVREARPKVQGWVAPTGTKINSMRTAEGRAGLEVTVERLIEVDGFQTYYGSNTDTIMLMRTPDGRAVKWKASNATFTLEPGDRLLLTSGSVKANDTYERTGEDQTVLTRVKFELLDDSPGTPLKPPLTTRA